MSAASPRHQIHRSPISHKMAYPVGFELLRDHFGDLPQWQETRLGFYPHPTVFASEFSRVLSSGSPYCILKVQHSPAEIALGWSFCIYPVLRELKPVARAALCESAFAALHGFISKARTHQHYRNKAKAIFDPLAGTCSIEVDYAP